MAKTKEAESTVVVIEGSLTSPHRSELRGQLSRGIQQAQNQGHSELLVSWENPGDIDGIGLALLLATDLEFSATGGQVSLRGFSDKHQELLKITRTDRLLSLHDEAA